MRFMREYSLSEYDAKILVNTKEDAYFAEECIKQYPAKDKKSLVNWLIGPLASEANARKLSLAQLGLNIAELISLIGFVERQEISHLSAKTVLTEMVDTKNTAQNIIRGKDLLQVSDSGELDEVVDQVIKENEKSVADFRAGKSNAIMFLVGQVMRKSSGKANPKVVQDLIKRRLTS